MLSEQKPQRVLTEAQQKIIEDYYTAFGDNQLLKCIHRHFRKLNKTPNTEEIEEYLGLCRVQLCEAVMSFDEKKNIKFSTFVGIVIPKALINHDKSVRAEKRKSNRNALSLDKEIDCNSEETLGSAIADEKTIDKPDYTNNSLGKYLGCLSPLQLKIILLKVLQKSKADICYALGINENKYDYAFERMSHDDLKRVLLGRN